MPFAKLALKRIAQCFALVSALLLFIFIVFGHALPNEHTWFIVLSACLVGSLLRTVVETIQKRFQRR